MVISRDGGRRRKRRAVHGVKGGDCGRRSSSAVRKKKEGHVIPFCATVRGISTSFLRTFDEER